MLRLPKPITAFFKSRNWRVAPFQRETWQSYLNGESGLIHAPTGTGKTLAAWFGPVITAMKHNTVESQPPLAIVWVTPMRALASDTTQALQATCEALDLPWRVEKRTGDSSTSARNKLAKSPPTALVTTPESLSLLLSYPDFQKRFAKTHTVIVDEWHELLGSKRGVQLELCLARLHRLNPNLVTWGISATIGNLDEAAQVLLGANQSPKLIVAESRKKIHIEALIPDEIERFPWSGHLGLKLLQPVIDAIDSARSTLVFTNTRSQSELWFEAILKERLDWIGTLALHHASLSRDIRDRVEQGLKEGNLQCVVCTSSLDLGVDFSPVEQVIQIGSPKGVARLLQRAGRSGHQPGAASRVLCVPTHAFELAEIAAARISVEAKRVEARRPLELCLDVLVQNCVTLAIGGGFDGTLLREEVKTSYAFRNLSDQAWQWVLNFITEGGDALQHYPEYHRVIRTGQSYCVESRKIALRHRLAIGTITSDAMIRVAWLKGGALGNIEESFLTRLKPNDAFLFNGRVLQLVRIKEMTALVRVADKKTRIVPRWAGGRAPLSSELAEGTRAILCDNLADCREIEAIQHVLGLQQKWSALPAADSTLVEYCSSREGQHLFVFTFAGRSVNEGIAALAAYRLTQVISATFRVSANDYGFELLCSQQIDYTEVLLRDIFTEADLLRDLIASINESESAKRQFRDIARIACLIFTGYPGSSKSTRQIQASSSVIFDVLKNYDPDNQLLHQAENEVLTGQLEYGRLRDSLMEISGKPLVINSTERFTPLAFPLWAERVRGQTLSSEKFQQRLERMIASLNKAADRKPRRQSVN